MLFKNECRQRKPVCNSITSPWKHSFFQRQIFQELNQEYGLNLVRQKVLKESEAEPLQFVQSGFGGQISIT